ncbi:hypothetical protein EV361DRAFT_385640 [Lentinula raphanica]|uniref:Uncharacterized protein n=1 Tax=Lentinula raphanica TaxID=153919 RepID=A0AA38PAK9_9AGAR|nr:hypothetical protein EV360DRAFT_81028 [Lentinula raphanica]KAJ3766847.1 hypothetical protein FB446DRAFT_793724 [Lentinula raphanica]KAJ3839392.1 hypothetical protein F5878DRAFT_122238 [Lentinula raphanica]KAJ3976023.1 hypothetical protein EV361DRAFT_385640 [Lentinula raphanica]
MNDDSRIEEIQSPDVAANTTQPREIPILIEQNSSESSGYSVASVAAVILAGSIAHLCLTWGGFTGQSGWDKLVAVEDWIAAFFRF